MATQALRNGSNSHRVSAIDQESLALLMSMRDNPEIQKDPALFKMFNDAISFMLVPTGSFTASSPDLSRAIIQMSGMPPAKTPSAPPLALVPFIQIDTSGQEGANGFPGASASHGGKGINGTPGSNGGNASDINLWLFAKDETVIAQWGDSRASMKLGDVAASVFLLATGGKGGQGGEGGKGGLGTTGAPGRNATRYSRSTNGESGGRGGPGGDGGDGGRGGKGGNVKVSVLAQDSDLLMLLNNPQVSGGAPGKGGAKGRGGMGGSGGQGGAKYTWTEMRYGTRQVCDIRGGLRTESYYTPYSCCNSSGSTGPQGCIGEDGRAGTDGRPGLNGSLQMIVGGTAYQTLYDLAIAVSKMVDLTRGNPADIYEPGEHVNLMVSVINTGGMPTPPQDIEISLRPAHWIEQGRSSLILAASQRLPVEGSHTFTNSFSFRVKDQSSPTEEPLNRQAALTYHAFLHRINKSFSNVSQQENLFLVRYPVQISPLKGKTLIAFDEKSTLSFFIQNITSIIMGKAGPQKRRVFVTLEISKLEDIKSSAVERLQTEEGDPQKIYERTMEIDHLSPKSEKQFAISFCFKDPYTPARSKVEIIASLHLGYFNSENGEQSEQSRVIQKRTIQVEFAKNIAYHWLLEARAKINHSLSNHEPAKKPEFLRAVREGNLAQVKELLATGQANINAPLCELGKTALHIAVEIGNLALVLTLIGAEADLEAKTPYGATPLHRATFPIVNERMIKILLIAGAQVDVFDSFGKTPLCNVAGRSPKAVRLLLEAGANVNLSDKNGATPLHHAVEAEDQNDGFECAQLLIEAKADINARTLRGETPLLATANAESPKPRLIDLLLRNQADPNIPIQKGDDQFDQMPSLSTPLHRAAYHGATAVVTKLLWHTGIKVYLRDADGCTPLHRAIESGAVDIVQKLLVAGAQLNVKTVQGKTPLQYAQLKGNKEILTLVEAEEERVRNSSLFQLLRYKLASTSDIFR